MKLSDRFSEHSLARSCDPDPRGRLFFNNLGITDLSPVEIVGAFVDTVRQLFFGVPQTALLERLQAALDEKQDFFELLAPPGERGGAGSREVYHLAKMGKVARYRYKLQNNDLGIVILFASYFGTLENESQHLKIELSPKFISARTPQAVMAYLNHLAKLLLVEPQAKGCAVHLACDYQNFTLPRDFLDAFSTHSRTVKAYDGLCSVDLSDLSEAVATYGSPQQERNYLIGKPSAVQMAVYDKSYEIIKSDKQDYFHQEWGMYSLGVFDPDKTVRRIEARVHHSIIREIGQGLGVSLEAFDVVAEYLTDIWRYALRINRLNSARGSDWLHPFWQLLMQDVDFFVPAKNLAIVRKKKAAVDPVARNLTMLIGNLITLSARQGFTAAQVMTQLKILACYPDILSYYRTRGLNESDLRQNVEKGLALRRLVGKAA